MTRILYLLLAALGLSACGTGETSDVPTSPQPQSSVSQPENGHLTEGNTSTPGPCCECTGGWHLHRQRP